jgi:Cft2 family RNA processing exonuclease
LKVGFLGGASEVGASCVALNIATHSIVLDSGIRMNAKETLPNFETLNKLPPVEAIIISHAHMDHTGSLPILSNYFPNAKIYMTHAAKDLTRVLLYDSLKIMDYKEDEIPIYTMTDVQAMLARIICFSPNYPFYPFDDDFKVTFYDAGHIVGAAAIYIETSEGTLFYSGDFNLTAQSTVGGASFPRTIRADVAIYESTYADRLHSNRSIEEDRLVNKIIEVVSAGKKILVPAFALGRAQEIMLILNKAFNKNKCKPFKVYVDGMVNDITRVFSQNPNYLKEEYKRKILKGYDVFYNKYVIDVRRDNSLRKEICDSQEGLCVISSSGMLTGGPSAYYAQHFASDPDNFIAITGYQDEESPGAALLKVLNSEDNTIKLGENTLTIKCGIGRYGLSAHSDKLEIKAVMNALGANQVFLMHGNREVIENFAKEMQKDYKGKINIGENDEVVEVVITTKRKQAEAPKPLLSMAKEEIDLEALYEFVKKSFPAKRGFTVEELFYIHTEKNLTEGDEDFRNQINASELFETERKRPYIYHYKGAIPEKKRFLEVNKALKTAEVIFAETDMIKCGARQDVHVIILNFPFPAVANERYQDKFAKLKEMTGWDVEMNDEVVITKAEELIYALLPLNVTIQKGISYFRTEGYFRVILDKLPENSEQIMADFRASSGLNLMITTGGQTVPPPSLIKGSRNQNQMEQNQAFNYIENAFRTEDFKPYKKVLKNLNGELYMELTFISPKIAERYTEKLDEVSEAIGYPMLISESVNQSEVLRIAVKLFEKYHTILKKNPSFMPKEMRVVCKAGDDDHKEEIVEEFYEMTGLELSFAENEVKF